MIHIVPSASYLVSLSPFRASRTTSPPFKVFAVGSLLSLSPEETEKIHSANWVLEIAAWVAEQTLQCPSKMIGFILIFPEDLGGHISHVPSSIWVLRELQLLESKRDVRPRFVLLLQLALVLTSGIPVFTTLR